MTLHREIHREIFDGIPSRFPTFPSFPEGERGKGNGGTEIPDGMKESGIGKVGNFEEAA